MAQVKGGLFGATILKQWDAVDVGALGEIKPTRLFHTFPAPGGPVSGLNGAPNPVLSVGNVLSSVVANVRPKRRPLRPYQIGDIIQEAGWTYLGSGANAFVYEHAKHPDKVIKICASPDPWPIYIDWARSVGELGKSAPLVYSLKPVGDGYWAVMEKLKPTADRIEWTQALELPMIDRAWGWNKDREEKEGISYGWDGYRSNIMLRPSTGELVLTDPLCGRCTEKIKPWSLKKCPIPLMPSLGPSSTVRPSQSLRGMTPGPLQPSIKKLGSVSSTEGSKGICPRAIAAPSQAF